MITKNKNIHWVKRIFVLLLLYESLCYITTSRSRLSIIHNLSPKKNQNPKPTTTTTTTTTTTGNNNNVKTYHNKSIDDDNNLLNFIPNQPTYLVTIKSPRSGSTFLQKTLLAKNDPYLFLSWEGTPSKRAKQHFESCKTGQIFNEYSFPTHKQQIIKPYHNDGGLSNRTFEEIIYNNHPWTCAVAINGYLGSERQWQDIHNLILQYNAKVIIQLRTNVVEKAISRSKRFSGLYKQIEGHDYNGYDTPKKKKNNDKIEYTYTIPISNEIAQFAMEGLSTIENHILSETKYLNPLLKLNNQNLDVNVGDGDDEKQLLYIWYEDMIRQCNETVRRVYELIGRSDSSNIPIETLRTCNTAHFQFEKEYPPNLVNALKMKEELIPMIDSYKYNMEVDTNQIYQRYKKKTQNVSKVTFGLW